MTPPTPPGLLGLTATCTDRWKCSSSSKTTKKCFLQESSPLPPHPKCCVQRGDSGLLPLRGSGRGDLGLSLVFISFWSRLKNWALKHLEGSCGGSLCAEAAQRLCTPDVYPGGQGKLQGEEALQGPLLGPREFPRALPADPNHCCLGVQIRTHFSWKGLIANVIHSNSSVV